MVRIKLSNVDKFVRIRYKMIENAVKLIYK